MTRVAHITAPARAAWERFWGDLGLAEPEAVEAAVADAIVTPAGELRFEVRPGTAVLRSARYSRLLFTATADPAGVTVVTELRVGGWALPPAVPPLPEPPAGLTPGELTAWVRARRWEVKVLLKTLPRQWHRLLDPHLLVLKEIGSRAASGVAPAGVGAREFTPMQRVRTREHAAVCQYVGQLAMECGDTPAGETYRALLADLREFKHRPPSERTHHIPDPKPDG